MHDHILCALALFYSSELVLNCNKLRDRVWLKGQGLCNSAVTADCVKYSTWARDKEKHM